MNLGGNFRKKVNVFNEISIDGCTRCQLRCPDCPRVLGRHGGVVGDGYLRFENYKKIIDDNREIKRVYLENRGEIFLNPEFTEIMSFSHEKNIDLIIPGGTNLNNLPAGTLEGVVKFRVKRILCSIDGATPETYKKYRVGGDFNKVIENVCAINVYKKQYRSEFPKLKWQFVVFGHNEQELPLARKMANELNMAFSPKLAWNSNYSPVRDKAFVMRQTGWPAVTREEYAKVVGYEYMRYICYSLWRYPRINWDGKLLGCCDNIWKEFEGNVFRDGYEFCYNSPKINYARKMLLGEVPLREDITCASCKYYLRMQEARKFLTMGEVFPRSLFLQRASKRIYEIASRIRKPWSG